ncbi:MAG: calcium-binding protein [Gemmobacter sp.]
MGRCHAAFRNTNRRESIVGTLASDLFFIPGDVGGGNDRFEGRGSDDVASGGEGDDRLYGNEGRDTFYRGAGDDRLWGEEGDDQLWNAGAGRLCGVAGIDRLFVPAGGPGSLIQGGDGDDTLTANGAGLRLFGRSAALTRLPVQRGGPGCAALRWTLRGGRASCRP